MVWKTSSRNTLGSGKKAMRASTRLAGEISPGYFKEYANHTLGQKIRYLLFAELSNRLFIAIVLQKGNDVLGKNFGVGVGPANATQSTTRKPLVTSHSCG
jgi:hypothetical protein